MEHWVTGVTQYLSNRGCLKYYLNGGSAATHMNPNAAAALQRTNNCNSTTGSTVPAAGHVAPAVLQQRWEGLLKVYHDRLAYNPLAQTERLADELCVQKELGGDRTKIDLFQKSVFWSHDLHVFAWQKIGSPYIQLVHSAREFHVLGGVSTLKGKPIGFMGDRIPSKGITPYAVLFHPRSAGHGRK